MKRRTFLERVPMAVIAGAAVSSDALGTTPSTRRVIARGVASASSSPGDLTPYVPRPDKPWDARRAMHLLRRAGFGSDWPGVAAATASSPAAIVDAMLQPQTMPAAPAWADDQPFPQLTQQALQQYAIWVRELEEWWFAMMPIAASALREKMTLFWHNHFVSEFNTVYVTQHLYAQNDLFRRFAFGDFRELCKQVTVDPAMLIYLDGNDNRPGRPNENYARELLELFTLGEGAYADGSPHYAENDIVELARALTGWRVVGLASEFRPARFDNGTKTIFGRSGNFGVNGRADIDVVDHIFEQQDRDHGLPRAAIFLCSKLYAAFVHAEPDARIVAAMAATLVDNGWNVSPVLRQLLLSEHFFDDNVMGAIVKSPADYVLGAMTALDLTPAMNAASANTARPDQHDPLTAMAYLAQRMFFHPNVKGWIGGREWLSSATVPLRIRYAKFWIEPIANSLNYGFDPVAFVKTLSNPDDVNAVVDDLMTLLLPVPVSTSERDRLKEALLGGGMEYEWDPDASNASTRIRACLIRLTSLAEFQLM